MYEIQLRWTVLGRKPKVTAVIVSVSKAISDMVLPFVPPAAGTVYSTGDSRHKGVNTEPKPFYCRGYCDLETW